MKKLIFLLLLLGLSVPLAAQTFMQTAFNSGSAYTTVSPDTLTASYSIGEAVVAPFPANGNAGFQQPWFVNLSQAAVTDSVWPGDANDDGTANHLDLLAIGLGFGTSGPPRSNASLSWIAQPALPWVQTLPTANYKHLDCDGNSLIEAADTLAIQQNYGLMHAQKTYRTGGIPLLLRWDDATPEIGDTLRGEILFGVDTLPVAEGYGLAFSLEVDTALFDLNSLQLGYADSWLGVVGTDAISLTRVLPEFVRADAAISRTDQQALVGFGMVASLSIIMIDDLAGKQDSLLSAIQIIDAVAINASGTELPVSPSSEPLSINTTTHIPGVSAGVLLFPNPATDWAQLEVPAEWRGNFLLRDVEGKILARGLLRGAPIKLDLSQISSGVYYMDIQTDTQDISLPIQVRH